MVKQQNGLQEPTPTGFKSAETLSFRQRILSWRWMTAIIVWFAFSNATLMRNSFNMALVCMTGGDPPPIDFNVSLADSSMGNASSGTILDITSQGEFDWDERTQGIILSSLLYFGFLTPTISGVIARKFGGKMIVGVSMTVSSIVYILTPLGARLHLYVLIALRVIVGCSSSIILPATQELWGTWIPDNEKVQVVSLTLSGVNIGSLFSLLVSGFLCTIPLDNGWPFVFYVFGGISLVLCPIWWFMVFDTPDQNKWISDEEKRYIRENIRARPSKNTSIPYMQMLKSGPMWAFVTIQTIHMWCATIYFTYLPKYMRDVLRFSIEENGVLSSVPFATRFIGAVFWSLVADHLRKKNFSTSANRKTIQTIGFLTCAVLSVATGYVSSERRIIAVILFSLSMFFQSCTMAASSVVALDMAPRLAGVTTGIFLGVGSFAAICAPIIVSNMTPNGTLEEWRSVFYMIAGCYVVAIIVFDIFGSAELQAWGTDPAVEDIITEPSNIHKDDSENQAVTNGHVNHGASESRPPPRVLIEREISVISTESFKSSNSDIRESPVIKVKDVYYLEDKDTYGSTNYGYDEDGSTIEGSERAVFTYDSIQSVDDITRNRKTESTKL